MEPKDPKSLARLGRLPKAQKKHQVRRLVAGGVMDEAEDIYAEVRARLWSWFLARRALPHTLALAQFEGAAPAKDVQMADDQARADG